MDAGRLTDSNGRTTDFRNVILVMTSNAGAQEIAKGSVGFAVKSAAQQTQSISMDALKKVFAPEFINRLDAVVNFAQLPESVILRVVNKFIDELRMQLQKKKVDLAVSSEVLQWIMNKGYDKVYGARPLARTIDESIKKPLVDELLFGKLSQGGTVQISTTAAKAAAAKASGVPADLKFEFAT
jgi:ATP-dependent Clp protease ATP-binding subunit ClpA